MSTEDGERAVSFTAYSGIEPPVALNNVCF